MVSIKPVTSADIGTVQTPVLVGPTLAKAKPIGRYLAPLPTPLGSKVLFVTGRGVISADVEVIGRSIAVRFHSCPDVDVVYRRLLELEQLILQLDAAGADPQATPTPGRCRICGCTMERACPSGCWWADDTETLCRQHPK